MSILIILTYCDRPKLVKGFVRSLLKSHEYFQDWKLAVIDDGMIPAEPIVKKILGGLSDRVSFYRTEMRQEDKDELGGTYLGYYANLAVDEHDTKLVTMIGDDDEITADYLYRISRYFAENPTVMSAYSDVYLFDPNVEKSCDVEKRACYDPNWKGHLWFGKPIRCAGKVDGIQVVMRRTCFTMYGASFPYPTKVNHDAIFFEDFNDRCGLTHYSGIVGLYKGVHGYQLIKQIHSGNTIRETKKERLIL